MSETIPEVDAFLSRAGKWLEEMERLRTICLDCDLTEELKWGKPCYTYTGKNLVIIQGFKEYCALMFFKGALLPDPDDLLVSPGNNTQAGRQLRFTNAQEISAMEPVIRLYIAQAKDVEDAGLEVTFKDTAAYEIPVELENKFAENQALKAAFAALTPGRQRAYLLYFSAPKQSKTRTSRVEKYAQQILDGKGLND